MAHNHAKTVGSRAEVWHGTAHHTSGGLTKKCLIKNKHGRIVSKKKHETAKKDRRLAKAGYGTKKGVFGYVKKNGTMSKKHKRSMKKRGKMGKKRGGTSSHPVKRHALEHYRLTGGGPNGLAEDRYLHKTTGKDGMTTDIEEGMLGASYPYAHNDHNGTYTR
tara:strand:- start:1847 stop:2332 length:486 start_codon:yes stop_codon:yes gene_type:complete